METLRKEGRDIVMATSTGAMPAWMVKRYPEVARVDFEGRRHVFGHRHNACPIRPFIRNIWRGWRQNWRSAMVRILISSAGM